MELHIPVPNVQWKTPDDGQRNCPKHVEFLDKNKSGKLVRLLVLLKRKFVTMHGHMNVKFLLFKSKHYLRQERKMTYIFYSLSQGGKLSFRK